MRFGSAQKKLTIMLLLTTLFFVVEIIAGYITNSMALIADSFHMFSDAVALVIAFISVQMSPKKWAKNTFGWARAEILGALVNAVFLCALCFSILIESIKRFIKPDPIHDPQLIMIVGSLGLLINLVGLYMFKDGGHPHHHHHGHDHGHGHSHGHGHDHTHHNHDGPSGVHIDHDQDHEHIHADHDHEHNHSHGKEVASSESQSDRSSSNIGVQDSLAIVVQGDSATAAEQAGSITTTTKQPNSKSTQAKYELLQMDTKKTSPQHKQKKTSSSQMNMRGVFLHALADALGSVIVMISAAVVMFTDWSIKLYIDPILSVFMVSLIINSTWPLMVESAMILLQTVPTHIQVDSLKKRLIDIPGVLAVHELHVWQLAGDRIIASAHIRCHNLEDYMRIAEQVKEFFHNENIHSTTIQPEFTDVNNDDQVAEGDTNCFLDCPPSEGTDCGPQTCCGANNSSSNNNTSGGSSKLMTTSNLNVIVDDCGASSRGASGRGDEGV